MLLRKVNTHPFDMDSNQIDVGLILDKKEKKVHPSAAKLLSRNDKLHPETTLAELVQAIKKRLPKKTMMPRQWEDFVNQFDECDADSKKTFNDFLSMLQRESFYRDTLAEALIFKQSSVRLTYQSEIKFLTQEQQKIQNEMGGALHQSIAGGDENDHTGAKAGGGSAVQPSFSYLIVDLIMFHFQETLMLLTTNDQGTCQLFDAESGVLQHEFIFEQSFSSNKQKNRDAAKKAAAAHLRKTTESDESQDEQTIGGAASVSNANASSQAVGTVNQISINGGKLKMETLKSGAGKPTAQDSITGPDADEESTITTKKRPAIKIRLSSNALARQGTKKRRDTIVNPLVDKSIETSAGGGALKQQHDSTHVIIEEDVIEENTTTAKASPSNQGRFRQKPPKAKIIPSQSVPDSNTSTKQLNPNASNFQNLKMNRMVSHDTRLSYKKSTTNTSFQPPQAKGSQEAPSRRMTSYIPRRPGLNNTVTSVGGKQLEQTLGGSMEYASVSGYRGGGATRNNTMMLQSARSRLADQRQQRIKEYDSKCKELIKEHERKQRVTQKLGLDFHIFEQDEDGLPLGSIPVRSQTAKNAVSKSFTGSKSSTAHQTDTSGANATSQPVHQKKALAQKKNFKQIDAWQEIPQQLDSYKARKEPIPFGMSEKIWDLDSYKKNYKNFMSEFERIQKDYEEGEKRLKQLRANPGEQDADRDKRTYQAGRNQSRFTLKHQDSTASFYSGQGPKKVTTSTTKADDRKSFSIGAAANRSSQEIITPKNPSYATQMRGKQPSYELASYNSATGRPFGKESKSVERRAYIPMKNRQRGDLVAKMQPMDRFKREMFLLHEHRNALDDIMAGVRTDQKLIAQTLQNNQLLVRVLEKQRDRNSKWLDALRDEERKEPKEQRLPEIDCIDFDRYEETYEERNQLQYDYMKQYQTTDMSIGQVMKNYITKTDKDSKETQRKHIPKTVKPSKPMFMTYYKKDKLVVFALLGELRIVQVKQNGQKKTFHTVASYNLKDLPVGMDIGSHKLTGKLLIFIACQSFEGEKIKTSKKGNEEQSYISVIEVDQQKDFAIHEKKTIYPDKPQISRILYKKKYGLIMACYRGYIEHFDGNNFKSVNKWSNNMKAIGSDKQKAKVAMLETKRQEQENFDDWIAEELTKRAIVKGGPGADSQMNIGGAGSEVTLKKSNTKISPKRRMTAKQIKEEREKAEREKAEQHNKQLRVHTLMALKQNKKEKSQVQTINCIDYSEDLYLIAFGGVHGQIGVLDSTTMSFIGMFDAHANVEVSAIYFYKKERQMISVSLEGDCALWDAQKMTILQTIRRPQEQVQKSKHISTSTFDQISGQLLLTTSEVFRYVLADDPETKIQIDQQLTVAANYLQQTKMAIDRRGAFNVEDSPVEQPDAETGADTQEEESKSGSATTAPKKKGGMAKLQTRIGGRNNQKGRTHQGVVPNSEKIIYDILNYKKLPQMEMARSKATKSFDRGSYTVLPSSKTRLIGCFFSIESARMFTIDADCLIRLWDLTTGLCVRSYPLEKPSTAGDQNSMDNNLSHFKNRQQIQALNLSPDGRVIAVAFNGGCIQMNNIFSGAVLYNKAAENMIDLGPHEISDLAFFHKQTNYWIAATLWEGKVAFLQRPLKDKGGEIIREKKVDSRHSRDVLCLDITETNHMATASIDNTIIFWNTYNAKEGKRVEVPESMSDGATIQAIRFAMRDSNDFLFVFMSTGNVYILETQSETFLEPPDMDDHKIINEYSFCKVPKFATFDIQEKENESDIPGAEQLYILAVEESGTEGNLHMATIVDPMEAKRRENKHGSRIRKRYTHKKAFTIKDVNIKFFLPKCSQVANQNSTVIKAEILPKMGMFVLSQASGVIGFYDIRTCDLIAYMNERTWSPMIQQLMRKQVHNLKARGVNAEFEDSDDDSDLEAEQQIKISKLSSMSGRHDGESQELTSNRRGQRVISTSYLDELDDGNLMISSPLNANNTQQMPHTAKNHAAFMDTPESAAAAGTAQQETMVFSAKLTQKNGATRNNFDATQRTKNSTQAQTSAGLASPI